MNSKFLILSFFFATNIGVALAQAHGSSGSGSGGSNVILQSGIESRSAVFVTLVQILDNTGQEIACIDSELFQYYAQLLAPGRYTVIYTTKEGYIIAQTEFFVE